MRTQNTGFFNKMTHSRKLIIGFLIAILIGALLLMMPFSLREGRHIGFLTSLFTTVSAICVTGLTVVDVSKVFSPIGHLIIVFFIQLGGLGVMTFSSLLFLAMGKKMTYDERELLKEERNADESGEILGFIKKLFTTVAIIEGIGAIILTYQFSKEMRFERAVYFGIFHSISAFCNAGFSLFSTGLEKYTKNVAINMTISYLIIIGGIGFAVINSIVVIVRKKINRFNLTLKVGVVISVSLTFIGTVLFLLLEYNNTSTLGELGFFHKLLASFFQSVTFRTAGFNTVPLSDLRQGTIFMACLMMFIGASPGSTGGGIKTTTFGVMLFYVNGIIKKKENIEVFNRRIDWEVLNRALAILIISLVYISGVMMLILIFDSLKFEQVLFEVFSAFGTVGLSLGITSKLNVISRLLIIITMLIGRLGPLTFALALGERRDQGISKYPKENILIG